MDAKLRGSKIPGVDEAARLVAELILALIDEISASDYKTKSHANGDRSAEDKISGEDYRG